MSNYFSTYDSDVFQQFKEIEELDFRQKVRNYEENKKFIRDSEFEEYFEMHVIYLDALFQIGKYEKHNIHCDEIIEACIIDNISLFKGEDIYRETIFKKAASHYNLLEFDEAEHSFKELIKMNSEDSSFHHYLRKTLIQKKTKTLLNLRAASIILFFVAAIVIMFELLIVGPFYPDSITNIVILRTGIFCLGILFLAGSEIVHFYKSDRKVKRFLSSLEKSKIASHSKF